MPRRCQSHPRVYRNGRCLYCKRVIKVTEGGFLWGHNDLAPLRSAIQYGCVGSWTRSWTRALGGSP